MVNYLLAWVLWRLTPPSRDEAVRYYTAAQGPSGPETAHDLAHLLEEMGRGDEATFRDLVNREHKTTCDAWCASAGA